MSAESSPLRVRSLLFVPATRPDRLQKALDTGADVVVVDLEDAVAPGEKAEARAALVAAVAEVPEADLRRLTVRINPLGSPWFQADVTAVGPLPLLGVVLPKVGAADDVRAVRAAVADAGGKGHLIVAGLESAEGVASARTVLGAGVAAAYFGAEDYIEDVGGRRTPDGLEVLHARSEVVLAGRLAGVPVIDQAVVAVRDPARFRADAEAGADLGYAGKICLHPTQVELAHEIWTPTAEAVAHARAVLGAAETAGVAVVDGRMVDEVHLRAARRVLRDAGEDDQ